MNALNVLCSQLTRDLFAIAKFCLVPFLPVIRIFVYFCIKVDEESDFLFSCKLQCTVTINSELCP